MNLPVAGRVALKDAARWKWMIALTLVLLARLVQLDSGRHYAATGPEDSWLYLLLPLAWSFLIALAVLEDPVVADAPFWIVTPFGWRPVVVAKAVFVVAFIHVPYFIGCIVIVQARGFSAFDCLPELLFRQFLLLAVTLPSLAIASVVRNVVQFMMIAIALMTAAAVPVAIPDGAVAQDIQVVLMCLMVVIAGGVIAVRQYSGRMTTRSRVIGCVAVVIAACVWWLPRENFYGLQVMLSAGSSPAPVVSFQPSNSRARVKDVPFVANSATFSIPVHVSGLNGDARFEPARLLLTDANGSSYHGARPQGPSSNPILMYLCCRGGVPEFVAITVDQSLIGRIGNLPLTLRGEILVEYYRRPETAWAAAGSAQVIEGLGRCSSNVQGGEDNPNAVRLHIVCESPHRLPDVQPSVVDPATGREWHYGSGFGDSFAAYLRGSWLSPIQRRDIYFSTTDEAHYRPPGAQWAIPREVLSRVKVGITPQIPQGSAVVRYEIPSIRLNDFEVTP